MNFLEKMHAFQAQGATIVVVAHSPDVMKSFCERVIWLEHGRLVIEGAAGEAVHRYLEAAHHTQERRLNERRAPCP